MIFLATLLAQLVTPPRHVVPVLQFPDPRLDDSAAYQGYRTRLIRDASGNTVQVYADGSSGRIVHLWANALNESVGFTVRTLRGRPATPAWGGPGATVDASVSRRRVAYDLTATQSAIELGGFLLGSMRVERDFQYWGFHRRSFRVPLFAPSEYDSLVATLRTLPAALERRHLSLLNAASRTELRGRLRPSVTVRQTGSTWRATITQPSLDARDTLLLEVEVDSRQTTMTRRGHSITLRSLSGGGITFRVAFATTGTPLTPLARDEVFTPAFLAFLADARAADSLGERYLRLERQVRSVELLSSREKLMAGLPTYATYFGRDMLVSALLMRSIWRGEMSEFVIASVLERLSPRGEVSHEEALGGQAFREAAAEYRQLIVATHRQRARGRAASADSLLTAAEQVLRHAGRSREAYHMIDDEYQLPVLVSRWIADSTLTAAHKRAFLDHATSRGTSRLGLLVEELGLVATAAAPYANDPVAERLVSFPRRPTGWAAASWRDSNVGYAGGRYGMDVNAIWVPHAVASIGVIVQGLRSLGYDLDSIARSHPALAPGTPLGTWLRDPSLLGRAAETWRGAERHFVVRLGPDEVRAGANARIAALPDNERRHWMRLLASREPGRDSLTFLAIALDSAGRPIRVANSDPATRLFLESSESRGPVDLSASVRDAAVFVRRYPVGLLIDGVGPVVANDVYATPAVWAAFERDRYHGPRVVWGREVNLFLLGVANLIMPNARGRVPSADGYLGQLQAALAPVEEAVEASGFHSELWSYEIRVDGAAPVRYGTGADVQLWSTTNLAVQYALWRLRR